MQYPNEDFHSLPVCLQDPGWYRALHHGRRGSNQGKNDNLGVLSFNKK